MKRILSIGLAALAWASVPAVEVRDYVVCNGSAYVDTGIYPDKTTRVVIDFETTDTSHDKMLFGERNGGYNFLCWLGSTAGTKFSPCIGSSGNLTGVASGAAAGDRQVMDMSADGLLVDGKTLFAASKFSSYITTSTAPYSLLLFGLRNGSTSVDDRKFYGTCYSCRIYHNGALAKHYLPSVDAEGVACLYDVVAKAYVYPAADAFTVAANVSSEWRVSDAGTFQYAVHVATYGAAGSVSDGSATGTTFWGDEGGTVTLTAVPAEGSKFLRWEGDVSSITSGTVTDRTITVSVDAVRSFTARLAKDSWTVDDAFACFHVDDRILTVDVPEGAISTNDYVSMLSDVTNVVKKGKGALRLRAASTYAGDWHVDEGELQFKDEYSFGMHGTATTSNGRIFVASGATLFALPKPNDNVIKYKDLFIAGTGWGGTFDSTASDGILNPKRLGVVVGPSTDGSGGTFYGKWGRWHLVADATYYQPGRPWYFQNGSIDVAGHTFTLTGAGGGGNIHVTGTEVVTNSSATAGRLTLNGSDMKNHLGASTFVGGPANVLDTRNNRYPLSVEGVVQSDWTFLVGGGCGIGGAKDETNPDGTSACYDGLIVFTNATKFYVHDKSGYTLNLKGSIAGDANASWTITRGHSLNVYSTNNTFAGSIALNNANGSTYKSRLKMMKDSAFSAKALTLDSSDFVLDGETAFDVCDTTVTAGDCTISGGAAGTTIASVTQKGTGTLSLDTPAAIPTLSVTAGSVVLTQVPSVTNLVCATEGALDLGGAEMTVDSFEGDPAGIANGTLHVCTRFILTPGSVVPATVDYADARFVCVTSDASLDEGEQTAFYAANDVALTNVYAVLAAGDYATFSKTAVTEGDHAGQTLVTMTITKTPPAATWAAPAAGGAWNAVANWQDATDVPLAATVTFPKAEAEDVPVSANVNAALYGLSVETGSGESDWCTPFGYSFAGDAAWFLSSDAVTFSFASGENTVAVPLRGDGTLTVDTELYPFTNVTDAVYSKTTISEKALEHFAGTLAVNPVTRTWSGRTELHTGKFAGRMTASSGEVTLDSLAFVKSRDDLTLNGTLTLAYAGEDVTIPGLTWNSWLGEVNVAAETTLAVEDFYVRQSSAALYKTGLGTLKLGGTGTLSFTRYDTGNRNPDLGFSWVRNVLGRPSYGRYQPISICAGTLEVGTAGDAAAAPTVSAGAMTLGNHNAPTENARLVVNNGSVNVSGTLWLPYYTSGETDSAVRSLIVNGGSFHAKQTDARIGWVSSDGNPYGRQVFEVNGGAFTIDGSFNLTQLCPCQGNTGKAKYQATMTHTFTVNGGEATVGNFKMGYAYGVSWDGTMKDNNGYGQGWQPDAYLTVNGGEMAVTDYLLTTDRSDSRSWTALNGGVLKVNMISNTVGTAASTYLTFNGGTLAPTGDGDNADELKLKNLFTAAVVSTNGAIVTTANLPADVTYVIEQPLAHDPLCGAAVDGGFTKRGAGTLELAGKNTFTGPVKVEGGTLVFADKTVLPASVNDLEITTGAKVRVTSGSVRVKSLTVDGVTLGAGMYGSSASGAYNVNNALFEGTGRIRVGLLRTCVFVR